MSLYPYVGHKEAHRHELSQCFRFEPPCTCSQLEYILGNAILNDFATVLMLLNGNIQTQEAQLNLSVLLLLTYFSFAIAYYYYYYYYYYQQYYQCYNCYFTRQTKLTQNLLCNLTLNLRTHGNPPPGMTNDFGVGAIYWAYTLIFM